MRTLVVYYSRTGTTKKVAEFISSKLNCDLEEIVDLKNRKGVFGVLKSGMEATMDKTTSILGSKYDPSSYDLVIIGTPIWNSRISSPMKTYLKQNKDRIKRIGFFCTQLGSDQKAFKTMESSFGKKLIAEICIKTESVETKKYVTRIEQFIKKLIDS